MATIDTNDLKLIRHMVGFDPDRYKKSQWGFRNYFAAGDGGANCEAMRRLEKAGLVRHYRGAPGDLQYFAATEEGCKAIGLPRDAMKRALSDD